MQQYDVAIIGAGAAGLMCGLEAARRGRRVIVVDHARAAGEKIRISGGGRCNFTNLDVRAECYSSENPKFILSALARYSQWDFIDYVSSHGIAYHEKTLGQLFCDGSARQVVDALTSDLSRAGGQLRLGCTVDDIRRTDSGYRFSLNGETSTSESLVVACGGKSIPKMGACGFGYSVARQFGISLVETRPGLVPLTFGPQDLGDLSALAGLSVDATVSCNGVTFHEGLLFTHRGLSGPSILQISSYWREGDDISVNLLPEKDVFALLKALRTSNGRQSISTALASILPKRLAAFRAAAFGLKLNMADLSDANLERLAKSLQDWRLTPNGSEGYRTAEVTLGGVSTDALSARTMEAKHVPGLFFVGEVVDVTGWLGGYNFQWAWSSGWVAGQVV